MLGLDQHRLDGVRLAAAAFTNLTHEHLDYHASMETYFAAKARLFDSLLPTGGTAIVNADSDNGILEGTATTFWFGFKDDVVVRIRPDGARTRVDVRSASRVGLGDVGTNARRIRTLLTTLTSAGR